MVEHTAVYYPPTKTTFVFLKRFDDVKNYPLTDSLLLVICITMAYLVFVLKTGPAYMKDRKPYNLKNTILAYNAFQVVISLYFVYLAYDILKDAGTLPSTCRDGEPKIRSKMTYSIYMYWLAKITELLDTVFFVLRKKSSQVTFLHVYHHASVVIFTYLVLLYGQSTAAIVGAGFNSAVHAAMYFYYGLSALGPGVAKYLFWKKHITNFQRVQFITMFTHQALSLVYTTCEHSILGVGYILYSSALFLYLFTQFYTQKYKPVVGNQNNDHNILKEN